VGDAVSQKIRTLFIYKQYAHGGRRRKSEYQNMIYLQTICLLAIKNV